MQKIILSIAVLLIILPSITLANEISVQKISLEQKGEFKSMLTLKKNNFLVPTMIDVPLKFNGNAKKFAIVTDSTGVIIPSTILNKLQKTKISFTASDSFESANANNMIDGNTNTFTEMPFVDGGGKYEIVDTDMIVRNSASGGDEVMYSQENYAGSKESDGDVNQNKVIIDVKSNKIFKSDSVKFAFGKNIKQPTRIKIVSVREDGTEQILLPEKFFTGKNINFPEISTKHYRITLHYIKPLRISEITFNQKEIPTTIQSFVRFIAQPQMSYDIYCNATNFVKTEAIELPNFNIDKSVEIIQPDSEKSNPLYKKADADNDGVLDGADNCPITANTNQEDIDKNGKGDACEDFDHDGIINADDNCPSVANHNQADEDLDGIGDKCDGVESRVMEKYKRIKKNVLNLVFVIVAGLIAKTLKEK
jgi:hypothetical protein